MLEQARRSRCPIFAFHTWEGESFLAGASAEHFVRHFALLLDRETLLSRILSPNWRPMAQIVHILCLTRQKLYTLFGPCVFPEETVFEFASRFCGCPGNPRASSRRFDGAVCRSPDLLCRSQLSRPHSRDAGSR